MNEDKEEITLFIKYDTRTANINITELVIV